MKCISRYWELTLRNEDELGGSVGSYRMEESRLFHQDLLSPLVMVAESEERL